MSRFYIGTDGIVHANDIKVDGNVNLSGGLVSFAALTDDDSWPAVSGNINTRINTISGVTSGFTQNIAEIGMTSAVPFNVVSAATSWNFVDGILTGFTFA